VERYNLQHLSSGDILREQRAAGSKLGKKASSFMDSGGLVPDEIIVEMMIDAINKTPPSGFILDGFPRTVAQAVELDKSLACNGQDIDVILNLQVDDRIIMKRLTGRRSCPKCGAVYHIENMKPKVNGLCDKDSTKLTQRSDDSPKVVANRLETYYRQTEPVIDYYKKNRMVFDIDANQNVDEVADFIFNKLDVLARA
jgi:adenylate kinase